MSSKQIVKLDDFETYLAKVNDLLATAPEGVQWLFIFNAQITPTNSAMGHCHAGLSHFERVGLIEAIRDDLRNDRESSERSHSRHDNLAEVFDHVRLDSDADETPEA